MSRYDLMTPERYFGVTTGSSTADISVIDCTQLSSAPRRITQSDSLGIQNTEPDHIDYLPKYDVSRKLEDFVINSTPRQLIKPKLFTTPVCR